MNNDDKLMKDQYADEVRQRWGDTEAYKESEQRISGYSEHDRRELSDGMDAVMNSFAKLKAANAAPNGEEARLQVERLKRFITDRMYTCTDEILAGLGEMYVADERFEKNIDKHGAGTAAYIADCIKSYLA